MKFLKIFNRKDRKIAELEARYEALDIIHSALIELYEELRKENEELKSNLDNLKKENKELKEDNKEFRDITDRLEKENERLAKWCESILKIYGSEQKSDNIIPYYVKHVENFDTMSRTKTLYIPSIKIVEVQDMRLKEEWR
nr:MAG TPA: cell division protein [Caudoviricetes sp.]